MKNIKSILCLMMIISSSSMVAQSKGEMPFSCSSSNANKLIRKSWIAFGDAKFDEGNNFINQALKEDPNCGIAYVSLLPSNDNERDENITKAEGMKLSPDEKMFIEGIKASRNNKPTQDYFEPLIKKYPSDNYLHVWIMFMNNDQKRAIEIGENIVKRNAKFAPAYNFLGYGYMNQNDLVKAEANFNKYVSLRPDLANVYDSKGDYMMRAGKTEEAIQLYEKAVSLGMASSKKNAERANARLKYPKPSDSDIGEIRRIITATFDAYKKSNADEILKDYSEQAIEIFGNQMVNVGMPNLKQRTAAMFKNGTFIKQEMNIESIDGASPIAIAYGKTESVWKATESGKESERKDNAIFLFRRQSDGSWKILADHFYEPDAAMGALSSENKTSIQKVLNSWNDFVKPGEVLNETNIEALSALYSSQAIEIYPSQRSNIGIANLRARWEQFAGSKFETNSLGPISIEGLGRRAVAWGIANQNYYRKDSKELTKLQFPWAFILTKEKDNVWRILAAHWFIE